MGNIGKMNGAMFAVRNVIKYVETVDSYV